MDVFLWGPLLDADLRRAVAGIDHDLSPATLTGARIALAGGEVWPTLVPDPAGTVQGMLWRAPAPDAVQRLDLWGDLCGAPADTVHVQTDHAAQQARTWTQAAPPGAVSDWSADHWQTTAAPVWRAAAAELFGAGAPDPVAARWQFPVMLKRAWARECAARDARPAALRHAAGAEDVAITRAAPPLGRFFRLQGFDVTHRRFDGGTQGPLPREVMVGVDAVMVLPYDPVRDRVLLVEQIRMGVLLRGDPNPWMLEPVAGMIDAFETPEQAALRETQEEAGLDVALRHVASFYPSPGNATDYFHTYVGLCDLPDGTARTGGLADEHEDLRLHVLPLDTALSLVASGEIAVGPCVSLIYWLALHRTALRLEFGSPPA